MVRSSSKRQPPSCMATARTDEAVGPPQPFQVVPAVRVGPEPGLELANRPRLVLATARIRHGQKMRELRLNGYPQILYKLTTGPIGEVLNQPTSVSLESFISSTALIELHWIGSPKDKAFLIQSLLLQLYYQLSKQQATSILRYFILIEEAHNILLRHQDGYETFVEVILRQIREYGGAIIRRCGNKQDGDLTLPL